MSATTGRGLFARLGEARLWIVLQFVVTLLLFAAGLGWTRLPDGHAWQVGLTLLIPVVLAICALELQAGTVRKLADGDGLRVKLLWGAASMLVWVALGFAAWLILDWCDDKIPLWSGYLNSKFSARARATTFTYDHIAHWLTMLEWFIRWIVLPAKLVPYAACSAQWGWRIPWRKVIRFLWNWRWWGGVVVAAFVGVWLPAQFFSKQPHGTVSAQVWSVILKLAATYVLAVGSWVLLLAWWATLFMRPQGSGDDEELVAVPVLSGPPDSTLRARAIPEHDGEPTA
jgi:hypothetical protein